MMAPFDARHHHAAHRPEKSFTATGPWDGENDCGPEISVNRVSLQEVSRSRAADLLRIAFPGENDGEIARRAGDFLGYSPRTVRHWLDLTHSMPFDAAFAIGCRIGVFAVMEVMTRGQSRHTILSTIIQGARNVFRR